MTKMFIFIIKLLILREYHLINAEKMHPILRQALLLNNKSRIVTSAGGKDKSLGTRIYVSYEC